MDESEAEVGGAGADVPDGVSEDFAGSLVSEGFDSDDDSGEDSELLDA